MPPTARHDDENDGQHEPHQELSHLTIAGDVVVIHPEILKLLT